MLLPGSGLQAFNQLLLRMPAKLGGTLTIPFNPGIKHSDFYMNYFFQRLPLFVSCLIPALIGQNVNAVLIAHDSSVHRYDRLLGLARFLR